MPNWRLLPHPTSDPYKIYFSSPSHSISKEIVNELKKISLNYISTPSPHLADIIIYLVLNPRHLNELPNLPTKKILIIKSTLLRHLTPNRDPSSAVVSFETYSSPSQIARVALSKFIHHYSITPTPIPQPLQKNKTKMIISGIIIFLITPWLILAIQIPLVFSSISCQRASMLELNIPRLTSCARNSRTLSRTLPATIHFSLGSSILLTHLGYQPSLVTQFLVDLSQSSLNFSQLALSMGTKSPSASQFANLKFLLSQQSEFLAALLADTRSLYQTSSRHTQTLTNLAKEINDLRDLTIKSQSLLTDLPKLLSFDSLTTYLILVQDSTELRPSGGFIDHAILATIDHGRLTNAQFLPSASLDRNPPERPPAPPDFVRLLNQPSWYFRDSNWDPDFSLASRYAAQLSHKAVFRQPDVIVAINSQIFTDFTNSYLAALRKDGAASTFMLDYSENLFNKTKSLSPPQLSKLIMTTVSLLDSRQIFIRPFSFTLPSLNQLGWDGSLHLPTCRSNSSCLTDFLYPTFTNISLNKSDAFTHIQSSLGLTFTTSRLVSNYTLELKNSSLDTSWPEGANKNYLRFILPSLSVVDQIQVNHKNFFDYTLSPMPIKNLAQLGLVVTTLPGSTSQINIQYHQSLPGSNYHYQLDILRQPGIPSSPLVLTVNYPADWFLTAQSYPSVARPGYLQYNTSITGISRLDLDISLP